MSRFFIKISTVLLIAVIFQVTSGFCFQNLFGSLKINMAQAVSFNDDIIDDMDACGKDQIDQVAKPLAESMPMTNQHNNSVLPCCVDGDRSGITVSSQSFDLSRLVLAILPLEEQLSTVILTQKSYQSPIIPPPELLTVDTTILRL